jgi:enoyl-CoA hydratase
MIETTDLDGVTLVTLRRPPVNALDTQLNEAITSTFGALEGSVVLTGAGRCFCAGVDLATLLDGSDEDTSRFLESLVAGFLAIFDYPGPVVAAVNGHALAGGCVIAMAADVRYMSSGLIGLTEILVGVPFPITAIEISRQVMGPSATSAALGGQPVPPEQALRLGWIDATPAADELLDVAVARTRTLGALSPQAYAFTKEQLHRPARTAIANGAAQDAKARLRWQSGETRARIEAFVANLRRAREGRVDDR